MCGIVRKSIPLFLILVVLPMVAFSETQITEEETEQDLSVSEQTVSDATRDSENTTTPSINLDPLTVEDQPATSPLLPIPETVDATQDNSDEFANPLIEHELEQEDTYKELSTGEPFQKPEIAIRDVQFYGEFEEAEKVLLKNHFSYLMSRYYTLSSSIETDSDRSYSLQITENEGLIQLNVTFYDKDKQYIEESVCNDCDTQELYRYLIRVVQLIVVNDTEISELYRLKIMNETTPEPVETGINPRWHITASSIALVSLWQSSSEAQKHNEYVKENEELKSSLSRATSSAEINRLEGEISDNESKIDKHRQNFYMFTMVALGGLCWEAYLLYSDFVATGQIDPEEQVKINILPHLKQTKISYTMHF